MREIEKRMELSSIGGSVVDVDISGNMVPSRLSWTILNGWIVVFRIGSVARMTV